MCVRVKASTVSDFTVVCSTSEWGEQYSMLRNSASGQEIGLPGRILAGLLYRESTEIYPPAGLRPAGGPTSVLSR